MNYYPAAPEGFSLGMNNIANPLNLREGEWQEMVNLVPGATALPRNGVREIGIPDIAPEYTSSDPNFKLNASHIVPVAFCFPNPASAGNPDVLMVANCNDNYARLFSIHPSGQVSKLKPIGTWRTMMSCFAVADSLVFVNGNQKSPASDTHDLVVVRRNDAGALTTTQCFNDRRYSGASAPTITFDNDEALLAGIGVWLGDYFFAKPATGDSVLFSILTYRDGCVWSLAGVPASLTGSKSSIIFPLATCPNLEIMCDGDTVYLYGRGTPVTETPHVIWKAENGLASAVISPIVSDSGLWDNFLISAGGTFVGIQIRPDAANRRVQIMKKGATWSSWPFLRYVDIPPVVDDSGVFRLTEKITVALTRKTGGDGADIFFAASYAYPYPFINGVETDIQWYKLSTASMSSTSWDIVPISKLTANRRSTLIDVDNVLYLITDGTVWYSMSGGLGWRLNTLSFPKGVTTPVNSAGNCYHVADGNNIYRTSGKVFYNVVESLRQSKLVIWNDSFLESGKKYRYVFTLLRRDRPDSILANSKLLDYVPGEYESAPLFDTVITAETGNPVLNFGSQTLPAGINCESNCNFVRVYRSTVIADNVDPYGVKAHYLYDIDTAGTVIDSTVDNVVTEAALEGETNTCFTYGIEDAPMGRYGFFFGGSYWIGGVTGKPGIWYYSVQPGDPTIPFDLAHPEKFYKMFKTSENFVSIGASGEGDDTGFVILNGDIFFFQEREIWSLLRGDTTRSPERISNTTGCIAPNTITHVQHPVWGDCVFFLSNLGPAILGSGGRVRLLSEFADKALWPSYAPSVGRLADGSARDRAAREQITACFNENTWYVSFPEFETGSAPRWQGAPYMCALRIDPMSGKAGAFSIKVFPPSPGGTDIVPAAMVSVGDKMIGISYAKVKPFRVYSIFEKGQVTDHHEFNETGAVNTYSSDPITVWLKSRRMKISAWRSGAFGVVQSLTLWLKSTSVFSPLIKLAIDGTRRVLTCNYREVRQSGTSAFGDGGNPNTGALSYRNEITILANGSNEYCGNTAEWSLAGTPTNGDFEIFGGQITVEPTTQEPEFLSSFTSVPPVFVVDANATPESAAW